MPDPGLVGELVGHFRLVAMIGRGGAGEVYRAEHEALSTRVAVKVLHARVSANPDHVRRFFHEAIAASRIQHAGIAKVFDAGFLPCGRAYLLMELIEGETLARRLACAERLPPARIAEICRQIASVLAAAHQAGIVHRDLKPENVVLAPDSELACGERVKIVDFGVAKLAGVMNAITNGVIGTPDYMAPEQWQDSRAVDGRADVYSLGCVAFEMATGRVPFPARSIAASCSQHLVATPPSVRDLVADLPEELDALISGLLQKRPDDRPATMRDLERAFATLNTGPAPARPRGPRRGLVGGLCASAAVVAAISVSLRFGVAHSATVAPAASVARPLAIAQSAPPARHAPVVPRVEPQPIDPYTATRTEPEPIDPYETVSTATAAR